MNPLQSLTIASALCLPLQTGVAFNRDIRPILTRHCTACHGGVKEAGGISFVFREKALATGESGEQTIIPAHPSRTRLVRSRVPRQPGSRIPARNRPLARLPSLRRTLGRHMADLA